MINIQETNPGPTSTPRDQSIVNDFIVHLNMVVDIDVNDPERGHKEEDIVLHSFISLIANDPPPIAIITAIARHIEQHLKKPATRWYA